MNERDYNQHLTNEEIVGYLEIRDKADDLDYVDFLFDVECHLNRCALCSRIVEKMLTVEKLIDKFFDDPLGYHKEWEMWKKEKRQKYQERAMAKLSQFLPEIGDSKLKSRLANWIELSKRTIVETVYFLTIYPNFEWKYEYEFLASGERKKDDATMSKNECDVTFKFTNFCGYRFGSTPPISILVPKEPIRNPYSYTKIYTFKGSLLLNLPI